MWCWGREEGDAGTLVSPTELGTCIAAPSLRSVAGAAGSGASGCNLGTGSCPRGTGRCSELPSQQFPALQNRQPSLFALISIFLRYFLAGANPRVTPEQGLA